MSYIALYRKLRPKKFSEVYGQKFIIQTLQNQISSNHISHAYLFTGTRGTGKTSSAKLFSKSINCIDFQNGEPCNKCNSCIEINKGIAMDVIEIDAASNNGVENIRDIISESKYPPVSCKFKVYIIDEVHMLSGGAFNALLKTLEEPPKHVVFILATTDPQKIPTTVLSRCQRFDFKRIPLSIIIDSLNSYMDNESKVIEKEAIFYIAKLSQGSMRDSLSILDQCLSLYTDKAITLKDIQDLVGAVDSSKLDYFIISIFKSDSVKVLDFINDIVINSMDIVQFTNECINYLRDILIIKSYGNSSSVPSVNFSSTSIELIVNNYKEVGTSFILNLIKEFSNILKELKYSTNKKILFEIYLLKICSIEAKEDYSSLIKRIDTLEVKASTPIIQEVIVSNKKKSTPEPIEDFKPILKKSVPKDISVVISNGKKIFNSIKQPLLKNLLLSCKPGFVDNNILYLITADVASRELILKDLHILEEVLNKNYNRSFEIAIVTNEQYSIIHNKTYGVEDTHIYEKLKNDIAIEIQEVP